MIGAGGIGSNMSNILCRAGFNIIAVDNDLIDASNLVRQNFKEKDISKEKSVVLVKELKEINPNGEFISVNKEIIDIDELNYLKENHTIDFVVIAGESTVQLQRNCYNVFSKHDIPVMTIGYLTSFGVIGPIINKKNKKFENIFFSAINDLTLLSKNEYFITASLSFYAYYISSLACLEIYKYFST